MIFFQGRTQKGIVVITGGKEKCKHLPFFVMVVKNGGTIWHRAKFDISGGAGTQQCQIDRSCAILTRTCAPQPSHLHKQCNFLLVLIKIAFLPVSANMGSFLRIIPRIRFMWSLLFLSRNKSANLDKKTWQIHALLCNAGSLDKDGKMWVRLIFWEKNENHFWQRLFWKDPIITVSEGESFCHSESRAPF